MPENRRDIGDNVALGKEEGDPEELIDDPTFEARFQARLVDIGRRFDLDRHVGVNAAPLDETARPPRSTRDKP